MMTLAFATRIGHPALGWILPGFIFVASFVLTWVLYRHFSRKL